MFIAGTLKKLKVSALNLFLEIHHLGNKKMKKNEKLVLISACLAKAHLDKATIEQAARKVNVEENVDLHSASLHPGVKMGTDELLEKPNKLLGSDLRWTSISPMEE